MISWQKLRNESPINWLLEETNPSIRYFTLRDLLGKSENDPQVAAAKKAIPTSPTVAKIMSKQHVEGYWQDPTRPYHPKYKSSYWQIMILSQLGMDKTDERVRKACEFIFRFQLDEGGFYAGYSMQQLLAEYERRKKKGRKLPSLSPNERAKQAYYQQQMSCLTGNISAALIRIGYKDDFRVQNALNWLVKIQMEDGGWQCPYWPAHAKDKHSCFMGTICAMEAFSEIPKQDLTMEIKKTIEEGAEFILMHRLFKADHHDYKVIKQAWLNLGFPWFWTYNILRGLDVLTKLGYTKDERLSDAVEISMQKRRKDGIWILENAPVGRMHTNIEAKGKPSKWITLIALRVLKRLS
jgi:Prenyltransferase and squalene oxidase repeat